MADLSTAQNDELPFNNTACERCKEEFTHDKAARLLHCLHTFCDTCLESQSQASATVDEHASNEGEGASPDDNKLKCPECKTEYTPAQVSINPFVSIPKKTEPRTEDGSPSEGKFPICTSCDDNQRASSFCVECEECLCDPCVIAHKRVKLTKDHTITNQPKPDQLKDSSANEARQKQMYCKTHKMEMLKLFCLTCEALTCRDCQLNEHKDHKYQFIEQTIDTQKTTLKEGVEELKKRLANNKDLSEKMSEKEKDIKKQQVEVFNEVRQVADSITNELISWCKQLLNFLQGVCHGRMRDLTHKKKEVDTFAKKASHTIRFVEDALESGDDLSVLFAKSFMSKNLKTLQELNINVPSSMFDLSIKYENDAKFLTKNVSKMGFINVNGKSYPQQAPVKEKTPTPPPAAASLQNLTPDNFCKNISAFLNNFPTHIREQYMGLSEDKRKHFLQRLMLNARQRGQQQQQQQQPLPPLQQTGGQNLPPNQNRANQFSTDSGAIQDLYGTSSNHPQMQHVRPRGTFYPENPVRGPSLIKHQLNQQTRFGQVPQQGPTFQQWRGPNQARGQIPPQGYQTPRDQGSLGSWDSSLQSILGSRLSSSSNSGQGQPVAPPPAAKQHSISNNIIAHTSTSSSNGQGYIPGSSLPPGRIDIDPLNLRAQTNQPQGLRIKQEPRENRESSSSCQFGGKVPQSVPQSPTNNSINNSFTSQGFTPSSMDFGAGLQSPPPNSHASPSLTPSPCHSDGAPAKSASPAATDINQVMDNDRNDIMKALTLPGGSGGKAAPGSTYHMQPNHDPNDPSEDYCRVCHNGGDLLCCDKCPKVFHLQCHIPAISTSLSSSEVWTCMMCTQDDDLMIKTPIPREFEINANGKRKAPNGLVDKEIKVCERLLLELFCLQASTVFHEPVPKSVPNYHKVIDRPMDFSTIKLKLRRGHFAHYNSIEEFLSDVKLVFRNCYKFNPDNSEINQVGKTVENFFESLVRHFLPSYVPHLLRRTPSPVPVLLDSNGGGDASKPKKRRSPAPDGHQDLDSPVHIL